MKCNKYVIIIFFLPSFVESQSFQSKAQCLAVAQQYKQQADRADSAWSDCAAGARGGQIFSCKGMNSKSKVETMKRLADQRNQYRSQQKRTEQICNSFRNGSSERRVLNNLNTESNSVNSNNPTARSTSIKKHSNESINSDSNNTYNADDLTDEITDFNKALIKLSQPDPIIRRIQTQNYDYIKKQVKETKEQLDALEAELENF